MKNKEVVEYIREWLKDYSDKSKTNGFVIGISGGIDSALTSTLCAMTGKPTLLVEMPIYQAASQVSRAQEHIAWLKSKFDNVTDERVDLTSSFDALMASFPPCDNEALRFLALANTRARLRMTTLYYLAGIHKALVAGTGNKVEDFGVGFYTKYGDGGVDLSPIADINKTQVYQLAGELGIATSILNAAPTDGLWGDERSDEDQIGASYPELEWAMTFCDHHLKHDGIRILFDEKKAGALTERQKEVVAIYIRMHNANIHKMEAIPVCDIPDELFE